MHVGFMCAPDCPLAGVFQSAADALATFDGDRFVDEAALGSETDLAVRVAVTGQRREAGH